MMNSETTTYLVESLEVSPAQAGTALATPHILHHMTTVILATAHMGHGHIWPINHGKRCASAQAARKQHRSIDAALCCTPGALCIEKDSQGMPTNAQA